MKFFNVIALVLSAKIVSEQLHAADLPENLTQIGEILHFPKSELLVQSVLQDELKMCGDTVLAAYRITGKTPFTFYPVLITVARDGTFLQKWTRDKIAKFDWCNLFSKENWGPLGSLKIGDDIAGGVYIGVYKKPWVANAGEQISEKIRNGVRKMLCKPASPDEQYTEKMAILSEINIPSKHIDVRIAVDMAFENGEDLVKLPGGERYFYTFGNLENEGNSDPKLVMTRHESRIAWIAMNELAINSVFDNLKESKIWLWITGATFLIGFAVFYWKRRK